jgi:hypothetical protein
MTAKPWQDAIVAEVREVREALFADAGHDIREFCRQLREREQASGHPATQATHSLRVRAKPPLA